MKETLIIAGIFFIFIMGMIIFGGWGESLPVGP